MAIAELTQPAQSHPKRNPADDDRWAAVQRKDFAADGAFYYCVKTTGIYCRPSCPARLARRYNVLFYNSTADAERAGFRPCKRCRPNEPSPRDQQAAVIANACRLIAAAKHPQPLEELASAVGMSPGHFHRLFKSTVGLTPKAYATARRARRAEKALVGAGTITSAIWNAGFSSNGRFYADSSKRLGMTPSAFKRGGAGATIRFAVGECSLGSILVAASDLGICSIAIGDDPDALTRELQDRFHKAELVGGDKQFEQTVARVVAFVDSPSIGLSLPLHVQGTAFQQRVWAALCRIPAGKTCTYSQIAKIVGRPRATRAVASACAANNLAIAIPCHRVVRTDGSLSGYRWGVERKEKLLKTETMPASSAL
jgi:AraC family transcriptional regulator of adaptative response/methylated-DNA-[protein]-cysteine methyltransferase